MTELFILTDAEGFTSCAQREDITAEVSRRPLLAPITVHHWVTHGSHTNREWRLANTYLWIAP